MRVAIYRSVLQSMKRLSWLTLVPFVRVVAEQDVGQFFNPPDAVMGTHDYSTNLVYSLGTTQTIKFTTTYRNYAINIWQQTRGEDAATRGPSIFSTEDGAVTQFDWQVQLYQFDLSASNIFFLWLTSNSPNEDGSDPVSVTSHYFNISDNSNTPNSFSTTPHSTLTVTSTQLPSTAFSTARTSTVTSPSTSIPKTSTASSTPSGLSTGAKAGIGIGATLGGLAIIITAFLLFRRSRQKHSYEAPEHTRSQGNYSSGDKPESQDMSFQGYKTQTSPVELGHGPIDSHGGSPVELPAGREYG
ncbi:hypothetical protein F5Y03DRAFT_357612 [Xylaria venustula]|nr:hypothetical protein F5Y03DRAFT_357612 [Xylaria venustula]